MNWDEELVNQVVDILQTHPVSRMQVVEGLLSIASRALSYFIVFCSRELGIFKEQDQHIFRSRNAEKTGKGNRDGSKQTG